MPIDELDDSDAQAMADAMRLIGLPLDKPPLIVLFPKDGEGDDEFWERAMTALGMR